MCSTSFLALISLIKSDFNIFNLFRSFEFKKDSLIKEITKIILLMADWINYMNF